MAEENIDKTPNGTGPFNVKIPGLSDPADIQEALRIYHYGSSTYDSAAPIPPALLPYSVAGHLHKLKTGNISFLYATPADFPAAVDHHGYIAHAHSTGKLYFAHAGEWIPLTDEDFVADAILAAVSGTTGGYPDLAGEGIDWNSIDTQFDLEPRINNSGTVIEKTASFQLLAEDVSKTILLNTSSGMTLTVPANSSVAIPVGYQYHLVEIGSGTTTFVPASGVTIGSKNSQLFLDGRYSKATLLKTATDSWVLYGDIYEGVAVATTTPAPTTTTAAPTTTTTTAAPTTTTAAPATTTTTTVIPPFFPPFFPTFTPAPTTPEPTGTTPEPTGTTPEPTGTTPAPLPSISSFSAQCENPDTGGCTDGQTQQSIWTIFNYSNASSYQITASPSTSNGSIYTSNANSDTDKYLGLGTKGTTYTLTLTVYSLDNQEGTSASQTISYTVPSDTTPTPTQTTTAAPSAFAITSTSSTTNSISYSWSNPPAGTVSYDVYYADDDVVYSTTNQTGTSKTYTGLAHSRNYTVFVKAKDSGGSILASDNATITTQAIATTTTTTTTAAPTTTTTTTTAAPSAFAITSTSSTTNSISYSWSNPPAGTTSYAVNYADDDVVYSTTNQTGTSKTYTGLAHSRNYTVFVKALNSSGSVIASDNATITTQAIATTTTAAPTTTTAAPTTTTAAPTTTTTTAAPATQGWTCTSVDVSVGCCASTGCSTDCGSGAACSNPPFNRCYQGGLGC